MLFGFFCNYLLPKPSPSFIFLSLKANFPEKMNNFPGLEVSVSFFVFFPSSLFLGSHTGRLVCTSVFGTMGGNGRDFLCKNFS